jgi:signal transduction histidine kinase
VSDDFFDELDDLAPGTDSESLTGSESALDAGLSKLASLVEDLNADLSTSTILDRAMSAAIELTGAERGFLVLVNDRGEWNFRVARNMDTGEIEHAEQAASHTVIRKVLDGRQPILINDVVGASDLTKQQSIAKMQVRSVMGAPLISKGKLLGAAYVDTSRLAGVFDQLSLVLFETFVQLAAVALENARLIEAEHAATLQYRELQDYLKTVLDSQPHGILIFDGNLKIEYATPQASVVLGNAPLTPGTQFANCGFLPADIFVKLLTDLQDFAAERGAHGSTFVLGKRTVAYSFFPFHKAASGDKVGMILEDITHRKQLEAKLVESEKQSTINQLAGGIAHEINNSLQPVRGRVELLTMRLKQAGVPIENGIDKDLATINALSTRIEKIAGTLRHLSKPAKPDFEPLNLGKLIRSTIELMESTTGTLRSFSGQPDAALQLSVVIEDNLPLVLGESHGLESAVINMVLNSAHAIRDKGKGKLTVGVYRACDGVNVVVEDTGGGIPPEVLPHIFRPYYTTRGDTGGTGLGMCIMQNVADIHNGKLDLQSEWGQGTRITLHLPAVKSDAPVSH